MATSRNKRRKPRAARAGSSRIEGSKGEGTRPSSPGTVVSSADDAPVAVHPDLDTEHDLDDKVAHDDIDEVEDLEADVEDRQGIER